MVRNDYFEIASIILSILLIFYFGRRAKKSGVQNRLFLALITTNMITAIIDVINDYTMYYKLPLWTDYTCSTIYFVSHLLVIPLFLFYTLSDAKEWYDIMPMFKIFLLGPVCVVILLVLTDPLTKWIYEYTADYEYQRNAGIYILYGISLLYTVLLIIVLIQFRARYSFARRILTYVVLGTMFLSLIIQMLFANVRLETFGIVYGFMILFYYVQNPRNQIDRETGLFNQKTFKAVMAQKIARKSYFDILEIVITDYDNKIMLSDDESVIENIADFFKSIEEVETYRYSKNIFCLDFNFTTDEEIDDIIDIIRDRFDMPWDTKRGNMIYATKMCHVKLPNDIKNSEQLFALIEEVAVDNTKKLLMDTNDFDMLSLERRAMLNDALVRAIEADSFELVLSAVYSFKDKKIIAAECSSRFLDEQIGYVHEREYIRNNDKSGLMNQLGIRLFDKTCQFLSREEVKALNLSFFTIKLSSISCLKYDFVKNVREVFSHYSIDPGLICFQISESTVSKVNDSIKEIMEELSKDGFKFCLDGYGSGYTNLASIYELPLSVIKLGKSVLRNAGENEKAQVTLESTLDLAKNLDMEIIIDGISEETEFDMATSLACDYAVGTFFLHDMDINLFLENIRMNGMAVEGGAM